MNLLRGEFLLKHYGYVRIFIYIERVIYGYIFIFVFYISVCFLFCRLFFPSPEAEVISKKPVPISCAVSCKVSHLSHATKRHLALSIGSVGWHTLQRATYPFLKSFNKRIWTWGGKCLGGEWELPSSIRLVSASGALGTRSAQMFKIDSLDCCVLRNQPTITRSGKDNWLTHNPARLTDLLINVKWAVRSTRTFSWNLGRQWWVCVTLRR